MPKVNAGTGERKNTDAATPGKHWAAPGLPPPPINRKKDVKRAPAPNRDAKVLPGDEPADRRDGETEDWIKESKLANTHDG